MPETTFSGFVPSAESVAEIFAVLAKSRGSEFFAPSIIWPSFKRFCRSLSASSPDAEISRGARFSLAHIAAAVPAAWPATEQEFITRVEVNARWLALMLRPAIIRFENPLAHIIESGRL